MEELLSLACSSSSLAGAQAVVTRALAAPGVFHFAPLLDCRPLIASLGAPKGIAERGSVVFGEDAAATGTAEFGGRQTYNLLRLFAFGTYRDYVSAKPNTYPPTPLTEDGGLKKLRILTVLSVIDQHAAENSRVVPYGSLMEALHNSFDSVPALEAFLVNECMYAGLVSGRLDQESQVLEVSSAVHRDLTPGTGLPMLESKLASFLAKTQNVLGDLAANQTRIANAQQARATHVAAHASAVQDARNAARATAATGGAHAADVDGDGGPPAGVRPKRGRGGAPK